MEKKFQIGDRVVLTEEVFGVEKLESGTIVYIDRDGDLLLKMDEDVDTYDYCTFNKYKSDRNDLLIVSAGSIELLNK